MSHFFVVVLIPKSEPDAEEAARRLLTPYNEQLEVPEYDRPCWCVGRKAERDASDAAHARCGDMQDLRALFASKHPLPEGTKDVYSLTEEQQEARDAAWAEYLAPLRAAEAEAMAAHPLKDKPDADCSECEGSGVERTTSNPKGKWDWWTVGGRWTGVLGGSDPALDPANHERCFICNGTGKRDDPLGREMRAKDPSYTCNACNGKGTCLKFPSMLKDVGNVVPTAELFKRFEKKLAPYAVVTPDGEWHGRGRMGWFGMSSGDAKKDDWVAQVRALLESHLDTLAVGVDCHV